MTKYRVELTGDERAELIAVDRNKRARTVEWGFTVDGTRHKLSRPYPKIELDESVRCSLTNH